MNDPVSKTKTTSPFSDFFVEDDTNIADILKEGGPPATTETQFSTDLPALPKVEPADDDELKAWWRNLRTFFRSGKGGGIGNMSLFPALLAPYRGHPQVRNDHPLWLADEKVVEEKSTDTYCTSLEQLLIRTIDRFAAANEATVLRASVVRIVENARQRIASEPQLFETVLSEVLAEVVDQLDVKGDDGVAFASDLKKLKNELPGSGVLIPFSVNSSYQILGAALAAEQGARRNAMKQDIFLLSARLKDILSVETEKSPEGKKSSALRSSYDFADDFMNFDEFANAQPEAGSELMAADRFKRIEGILNTLDGADTLLSAATIIIQKELHTDKSLGLKEIFSGSEIISIAKGKTCVAAAAAFEEKMQMMAQIVAAMRVGELELNGLYNHEVHGDHFTDFNWRSFTDEEMAACPPVVLIADATSILDNELSEFSHLLSSTAPVKIMAVKTEAGIDPKMNGSENSKNFVFRQELDLLAISHRNTFTMRSTPVSPVEMFEGFSRGLAAFTPALFYVLSPTSKTGNDPYLLASAAVEGRDFPGFEYRGGLDNKWGSRFNISNNPQVDLDWPIHELKVKGSDTMNVAFTFADMASLDAQYGRYLQVVPPKYWTDDLIEIGDFLNAEGDEKYSKIPFIWMTDDDNVLQKVAVSWSLVLICRERSDLWHYIQENGGVHSYHVEKAMDEAREELEAEADKEINVLKEEHAKEIEQVKDETAGQAMEKLTAMLLDLDSAVLVSGPTSRSTGAPASSPTTAAPEDAPVKEAPEKKDAGLMSIEAYIDTPLCTTCDECTDLNDKIFEYDGDKLAFIADPKGGPFVDIVEAAELCPVSIIHPGTPQDPNEPGLEDLVERANKYN